MRLYKPKLEYTKTQIMTVLILFVFLPPQFISSFTSVSAVLWYLKLLLMVYNLLLIFKNVRKLGLGTLILGIYFLTFIVSTFTNDGNISKAFSAVLPQFCFFAYADIMMRSRTKEFINSVSAFLVFYIVANAIILLIFPDGIGRFLPGYDYMRVDSRISWLGLDNGYIKFFLIAFVVFSISYKYHSFKKNALYVCMLATMVFVWSGTGIIGLTLMIGYVYFFKRGKISKIINYWVCFGIGIATFFGIVVFRITDYFSDFIVDVLGKDITFTGRTLLWDQAMLLIAKKPLWGYGVYDYDLLVSSANGQAYSAHDTVLQMMLMGGTITLIAFIAIAIVAGIRIGKCRKNVSNTSSIELGITCIAVLVMWICGITENMVFDIQIYFLFLIEINLPYILSAFQLDDELEEERIIG
ncbi:O-antigen ligase family protein [Eisenbergiella sp.]